MKVTLRTRRATAAEWTAADPVLGLGELALETDTAMLKAGDGVSAWSLLPYIGGGGGGAGGAPTTAQYVTAALDAGLGAERVLTPVAGHTNIDFATAAQAKVGIQPHLDAADPHPQYATDADLAAHVAAADPHPVYLTAPEGNAAYSPLGHTHAEADVVGLVADLAAKVDAAVFNNHHARHENGGADELLVTGLSGVLADPQPPIIGATAVTAVAGNDPRLVDARTPLAHKISHQDGGTDEIVVTGLSGVLADPQPPIIGATATTAVAGNDPRLTNARAPTAHAATHQPGGTDAMAVDAIAATGSLRTLGVGAQQAASGTDARFTDARTPTAHAATHKSGGSDLIKLDELGAPTDIATLNASAAAHGLLPKLSGIATDVLLGTGVFGAAPAASPWLAVVKQAADLTSAAAAFSNTDLIFNFVAAGIYLIDLYLFCTSVATTTGYRFAFDTSVAVTSVGLMFNHVLSTLGTTSGGDSNADATARGLSSGVPVAGGLNFLQASGILVAGANPGTCRLVFGPEVAASATFKANSVMRVHKAF